VEPQGSAQPIVRTVAEAAELLRPFFAGARGERIAVLHLAARADLIRVTRFPGSLGDAEVPVRRILRQALRFGSVALIVAHNHPSGNAAPSEEDREATAYFAETARRLGIELRDHLIFAGDDCMSFRSLGLL
jgi:DNA repair protein RadC